jgi:hypothetical protein
MPRATLIARMSRKFWKVFGTVAALVVVLGLLFVVAFIFNPFEGSIADIRELVPRQSDYFVRKTDLREDFTEFPEPVFWNDFAASASWRDLRNGPAYVGLQRDAKIEEAVAGLRQVSDQIRQATGGSASLLGDVLGSELVLAGKFGKTAADPGAYCAYLRISWKVRFAWGLLEWESEPRDAGHPDRAPRGRDVRDPFGQPRSGPDRALPRLSPRLQQRGVPERVDPVREGLRRDRVVPRDLPVPGRHRGAAPRVGERGRHRRERGRVIPATRSAVRADDLG